MRLLVKASLLVLGLAACSGTLPPINVLASAEKGLTAADQVLVDYAKLPLCGGADPICSDPALVMKLKADSLGAFNAVEAARPVVLANPNGGTAVETAMTLVNAAIAALTADLATIPASTRNALHG